MLAGTQTKAHSTHHTAQQEESSSSGSCQAQGSSLLSLLCTAWPAAWFADLALYACPGRIRLCMLLRCILWRVVPGPTYLCCMHVRFSCIGTCNGF